MRTHRDVGDVSEDDTKFIHTADEDGRRGEEKHKQEQHCREQSLCIFPQRWLVQHTRTDSCVEHVHPVLCDNRLPVLAGYTV